MVSAWCTGNEMLLGQLKVNDKSNEITASPELAEPLNLRGCVVTIDTIGWQKEIAAKMVQQGADYIFAAKESQKHLHNDIKEGLAQNKVSDTAEDLLKNNGRIKKEPAVLLPIPIGCAVKIIGKIWKHVLK
ncbi:MAG: ISAs1 family transposase [Bacteroidetes bacterium]|nr:MAG: ISAs1 family transposase [Bacteroidota bacterium]